MARYSDEDDVVIQEQQSETEITLGWGMIAGLIVALLVICGLCFWLGYRVGHRRPALATPVTQTAAPDQEPLQGNSSVPKPTASDQAAIAPTTPGSPAQPGAVQGGESADTTSTRMIATTPQAGLQSEPTTNLQSAQPQVRPALGGNASEAGQESTSAGVSPAQPSAETLMVQVAAVKHAADADVLTDALRKRAYPVSQYHDPVDGLIHVRVGPFNTHEEADRWRMKLLNDGYNAIVQP